MADLPIRLTCADYARVMPLAAGELKPDGIDGEGTARQSSPFVPPEIALGPTPTGRFSAVSDQVDT